MISVQFGISVSFGWIRVDRIDPDYLWPFTLRGQRLISMADESRDSVILEEGSDTECVDQTIQIEVGAAPSLLSAPRGKN